MPASALDPLFPSPPPPTQDELPWDDGEPMESPKHLRQMMVLIDALQLRLKDRPDIFVGGNLGLYYSTLQAGHNECRAPDVMVVLDAIPDRQRKSWVVWEENGRGPDVVIEVLSDSTREADLGRKKQIYAGIGVREYFVFDPLSGEFAGMALDPHRAWRPIARRADGDLPCEAVGLHLGSVDGELGHLPGPWLRWKTTDGVPIPLPAELAEAERARADAEQSRADAEQSRADAERARAERLAARLRAAGLDPDG